MESETVGILIARARQRKGLTQVELARVLGVAASTVANWERGVSYPLRKPALIEDALGITIPPPPRAPEPQEIAS